MSHEDEDHNEYSPTESQYEEAERVVGAFEKMKAELIANATLFAAQQKLIATEIIGYVGEALDEAFYDSLKEYRKTIEEYEEEEGRKERADLDSYYKSTRL